MAHLTPDGNSACWSPKCEIVIHPGRQSYLAAVGAGGAQTFASSWIDPGRDKHVAARKIDMRGDGQLGKAALPHEITHVILADLLNGAQPPRWADEGLAILADSPEKQRLHERDLADGLRRRLAFSSVELVTVDTYPHPSRVPAFYGQSASLTAFLVTRDTPARFVEFLRASREHGYDEALRKIYAIQGLGELDRLWQAHRQEIQASPAEQRIALAEPPPVNRQPALVTTVGLSKSNAGGGGE